MFLKLKQLILFNINISIGERRRASVSEKWFAKLDKSTRF